MKAHGRIKRLDTWADMSSVWLDVVHQIFFLRLLQWDVQSRKLHLRVVWALQLCVHTCFKVESYKRHMQHLDSASFWGLQATSCFLESFKDHRGGFIGSPHLLSFHPVSPHKQDRGQSPGSRSPFPKRGIWHKRAPFHADPQMNP
jgi:hypothetical protein